MGGVIHGEGTFPGTDGTRLYRQWWLPAEPPRGVLVNVHGLGDHSGLYPMLPDYFVPLGLAVQAFDLRGNGRSEGPRGFVEHWEDFQEDLDRFLALIRAETPDTPVLLLGNSLGGTLVLDYALEHPQELVGVTAAAPALGEVKISPVLIWLARSLSRVWPRFSLTTGLDLTGLSRDPATVEFVLADPLFHRKATARLATEYFAAVDRIHARAPRLAVPTLLLHGTEDRMVPPAGTRAFAARSPSAVCRLIEYPGAYHALFADLDGPRVAADLARWIDDRLSALPRGRAGLGGPSGAARGGVSTNRSP